MHITLYIVLSKEDYLFQDPGESLHVMCCILCVRHEDSNHSLMQAWSFGARCTGDAMGLPRVGLILGA